MRKLWIAAASLIVWMLAAGAAQAQQEPDYASPEDCVKRCFFVNLKPLLDLQREGGDVQTINVDELIAYKEETRVTKGKEVASNFQAALVLGVLIPPLFDEVVRITIDTGAAEPSICTGLALGRDAVLTAGHCGCAAAESYSVQFPRRFEGGEGWSFHPDRKLAGAPKLFGGYDCRSRAASQPGRDLALLFLKSAPLPIDRFDPVAPPAVSVTAPYKAGQAGRLRSLLVMGYGRREDGSLPAGLVIASSQVRDLSCRKDKRAVGGCQPFREFSLATRLPGEPGADTCAGDSGSPVYYIAPRIRADGSVELHRLVVGLTSRGLGNVTQFGPHQCGGGGIYTAIGHPDVLKWLALNGVPLEVGLRARRFAERSFAFIKVRPGAQTMTAPPGDQSFLAGRAVSLMDDAALTAAEPIFPLSGRILQQEPLSAATPNSLAPASPALE